MWVEDENPRTGRLLSNPKALYEHTVKFPFAEWRGSHGVCLTRNADGSVNGSRFPNYEYTGCLKIGPNKAFDQCVQRGVCGLAHVRIHFDCNDKQRVGV